jgi:hypothetical protein
MLDNSRSSPARKETTGSRARIRRTTVTDTSASRSAALRVALNSFAIQLRPSELESVAAGLSQDDQMTLVESLRRLPVNDRAPAWELAVRHLGRHTELAQAAGEIGMDLVHARGLLEALRTL